MKDEATFGPGTDLVISMFSMALILIAIVSGLYFDAVNAHASDAAISHDGVAENTKLQNVIRTLEQEIIELQTKINQLKEKNSNLVQKNTQLTEQLQDTLRTLKEMRARYLALEAANIDLKVKLDKLCNETDLQECGGVPKRSSVGKVVYFIIQPGRDLDNIRISTKGKPRAFVTRRQAHEILSNAKIDFGNQLYVGLDIGEEVPRGLLTKLICEFRQYDYYEYHNKNECKGHVPLNQQ